MCCAVCVCKRAGVYDHIDYKSGVLMLSVQVIMLLRECYSPKIGNRQLVCTH